jgi:hypothetical protein
MKGKRLLKGKRETRISTFAFKVARKIPRDRGVKDAKVPLGQVDPPGNLGLKALPGRLDRPADKSWAWIPQSLC